MSEESFQVLCLTEDHRAAMVITPYGALPEVHPEAHCFLWADRAIRDREPGKWNPISALQALLIYNKELGKGWEHAALPGQRFGSLKEVSAWLFHPCEAEIQRKVA